MSRRILTLFVLSLSCALSILPLQAAGAAPSALHGSPLATAAPWTDSLDAKTARPASSSTNPQARREEPVSPDLPPTRFSGQIFANYSWNTTGTEATERFNSFALKRWYFTVNSSLSEQVGFRGTTDVKPSDTGYTVIVKYAYIDWAVQPWLGLRAGVQQTGWQNYVNNVWGYRGVAKTMAQYQGHLSMADLGATLTADLPNGVGQAALGVLNGQGYRSVEANRFKDVTARLRLTPFTDGMHALAPLQVGGHYYEGHYTDGQTRQRWGGIVAYRGGRYTVAVNYEQRKDGAVRGRGVSGFGTARLVTVPQLGTFTLLGLMDVYRIDDPSGAAGEEQRVRSIVGLAYQPADGFTLSLDYQQNHADAPIYDRHNGALTDVDANLYLHVMLNF
jgi:hypothetical protein